MRNRHGFLIENEALMDEWDWDQNSKENLDPNILRCGSSVSANWICSKCGNHWKTRISHRAVDGSICPECNKRLLSKAPLEKSLAYLYPDISKEWSKKNLVSPKEVYPQSNLEYWWVCPNGHPDYKMPASKRTGRKDKCPLCSNKIVVSGINDLATTFPNLMSEWDWELNNKDGYDPYKISYGSKVKAHWKCQRNHQWRAAVYSRTTGKCNCSKCSKELKTSYPEKIIAFYISKLFPDTIENYRGKELKKSELDVYIPSLKVGIEYDGSRWHKNQGKDLTKDVLCESLGIFLIRVREIGASEYISNSRKIFINEKNSQDLTNAIREIIDTINKEFGLSCHCDVDIDRDQAAFCLKF